MSVTFGKKLIQSGWIVWEKGFGLISRLRSSHMSQYGICKVFVRRHQGKSLECGDGTFVRRGDWIGELHLDNEKVLQLLRTVGARRAALITARMTKESLREISAALETMPEMVKVKALTGVTLLHRGITHGLGFEIRAMESNLFYRLSTVYLRFLLKVLHPDGQSRIDAKAEKLVPLMLIHSRASLLQHFSSKGTVSVRSSHDQPLVVSG